MTRRSPLRLLAGCGALAVLAALGGTATASTPAASPTASPSPTAGKDVIVAWTGTIPPGANSGSDCTTGTDALNDHHRVPLAVPAGFY